VGDDTDNGDDDSDTIGDGDNCDDTRVAAGLNPL